jgi:hypothetical protein
MPNILQEVEAGLALEFQYVRDGDVVNVADADEARIWVLKPGSAVKEEVSVELTDQGGLDGVIRHVFSEEEMIVGGTWRAQSYLRMSGWSKRSPVVDFYVESNLP